jgi:hypothetical protein
VVRKPLEKTMCFQLLRMRDGEAVASGKVEFPASLGEKWHF